VVLVGELAAAALPLAAGVALAGALRVPGVRFVVASLVLAAASVVAVAEVLSLFDAFTGTGLVVGESIVAVGAFAAWWRRGWYRPAAPRLGSVASGLKDDPILAVLLAFVAAGLASVLVLALAFTPNNWDSMYYHLPRAAYWLQEQSIAHFEGASQYQLFSGANAEILQAWTFAVTGGESLVQLVQWISLIGLVACVYCGARLLELGRRPAAFAAALFATFPEPVLQASTPQNDLTASFLVAAGALFAVGALRSRSRVELALAAIALGLAVGTKGTTFIAGPSLLILVVATVRRYRPPARFVAQGVAACAAAFVALGLFNYVENVRTSDKPFGTLSEVNKRTDSLPRNFVEIGWAFVDSPGIDPGPVDTVVEDAAEAVAGETEGFSFTFDSGVHEDSSAFGLLGLLALLPLLAWALVARRSRPAWRVVSAASLAYVVTFAVLIKSDPYSARTLIPGVALGAPLLALLHRRVWMRAAAVALALAGLIPAVWDNSMKPLDMVSDDRIAQQTIVRDQLEPMLRRAQRDIPPDARIGYVGTDSSWDYPFFGPERDRHVVRIRIEDLRSTDYRELIEREDLYGVVFAEVDPPAGLETTPLGGGYSLLR
jgi:4-amino-4-deoxy-L-arabinose transferase-like glycosyltransferase